MIKLLSIQSGKKYQCRILMIIVGTNVPPVFISLSPGKRQLNTRYKEKRTAQKVR